MFQSKLYYSSNKLFIKALSLSLSLSLLFYSVEAILFITASSDLILIVESSGVSLLDIPVACRAAFFPGKSLNLL